MCTRIAQCFDMQKVRAVYALTISLHFLMATAFSPSAIAQSPTEISILLQKDGTLETQLIQEIYSSNQFLPLWHTQGRPSAKAFELRDALPILTENGLRPRDYWPASLDDYFLGQGTRKLSLAEADTLLTKAYVTAAIHIAVGRVEPAKVSQEIKYVRRKFEKIKELKAGLVRGTIDETLRSLAPTHALYQKLQSALKRLHGIAATQAFGPISPAAVTLKVGSNHPTVKQVKQRLALMGYQLGTIDSIFDEPLSNAIRDVQRKNLTRVTGILSPKDTATWEYFSVSLARRIQQVEMSLEKLRWLPERLEEKHVFINLATQRMNVVDPELRNAALLDQNIVAGRVDRKTPSMREELEYVVFNPTWTIPPDIYRLDKVPAIQEQVATGSHSVMNWFAENRFSLLDSQENPADPLQFDWLADPPRYGEVFIRQQPGTDNALGVVKFMMPNPYSIYLHDTNAPELLSNDERLKSSGCIRLSYPREFAEYLLSGTKWNRPYIDDFVVKPGETRPTETWVRFPNKRKLPVYIMSITVDVGSDGVLNFTRDIYAQNLALLNALQSIGFHK